ncbi:MAG: pyruvate flavodoxin/ferredoxin oxidoreductase [Deltaproteobacteria bacterium]|nr:pyruvate flavodoxin/ferredoxin oxidoreductase [Deltaproteobacteria bacterium]MBW2677246.1 pyruvate flavodoxin/ferredoxin oxidoreductase [Deltaproteobacteria bacterium]
MAQNFMEGNEAVAWGAFRAGCRFFAGYPITPATTILNTMLKLLPPAGGICIQGEDEIASMGFCLGASMAGMKVLTATSGPGISLYSENISFAIGSEIPLVIVDVQRLGPSTGSATRGADGDIQFLRWGNTGGLPVVVLAPVNAVDCYQLTAHAFNIAETLRCPVFIASNKETGMTKESFDMDAVELPKIKNRIRYTSDKPFLPFAARNDHAAPEYLPIGGPALVRQTSSTHGMDGYITVDREVIAKNQDRLEKKLKTCVDQFTFYDFFDADTDTLLITYGVTSRAAKTALSGLNAAGTPVAHLILKTLWPVPENLIRKIAAKFRKIVVVEMNLGQYAREIRRILNDKPVAFFGQMDGNMIPPSRIKEVLTHDQPAQ